MASVATASAARGALPPSTAIRDGAEEEASTEELFREAESAFGEIFSVKAPRDVLAGLWSGAQCVLSGVFLGVAGLITQPFEGFREAGMPGCFRGVALGLCTGLFFGITGLCTGVFQAIRGVAATPKAICMAKKGWQWDAATGCWAEPQAYSLPAEAARVLGEADEADGEGGADGGGTGVMGGGKASPSSSSRRRVADTYYYDQLCVSPAASPHEIRRAYFQQSRQWHPDKTSDDGAKERFQAISEAYQVLSDPARRRAYDTQGREGAGEGFVDAQVFFRVLLGVDAVEPYIGPLKIVETFGELLGSDSGAGDGGGGPDGERLGDLSQHARDAERAQRRQARRQVELAISLAERLDRHGREIGRDARKEARGMLQKDASVERFLLEIGWVYRNRAELYLARLDSKLGSLGARALLLRLSSRKRQVRQQATTAKLAIRSIQQLRKIATEADEGAASAAATTAGSGPPDCGAAPASGGDELPSAVNDALPTFLEAFWSLTSHDITGTLDKVVERVLGDHSVDAARRRLRAEALLELGSSFVAEAEASAAAAPGGGRSTGGSGGGGSDEDERKRRRFEEAFVASIGGPGTFPAE